MTVRDTIADQLRRPLVDRRTLLRLGLTESSVDHIWRRVPLARINGDTKLYARREDVIAAWEEVRR